ncbi:hypothetical protein JHS3_25760 [Jeongeupia sp. HS-3]|uniref:hypothetical protein n=1 Tax=Jeongeupia sp. HS-3 TaxID=1009682 RepID=UPI0018A3F4C6|nr:hypothetical protein [Jeongeupia sp. HS-3]BCL76840.1 hypothetical protein JHS3_25760 [Jeongeupia sp. HS-3]
MKSSAFFAATGLPSVGSLPVAYHPDPLRSAEQRKSTRDRRGSLFERSEFAIPAVATEQHRAPAKRARMRGRLFFGYFLLAKQKKVSRPPGGTGIKAFNTAPKALKPLPKAALLQSSGNSTGNRPSAIAALNSA